jgi:hypothetical protein
MTDLRKLAEGKPCMIRIPGICNHDPATTVLAHIRMAGITGAGIKAPDLLGAWACSDCHDECDRRTGVINMLEARLYFYEGIIRTQNELIKMGVVKT